MLSRKAVRKIFKEHKGAAAHIARVYGWTPAHVSQCLSGKRRSPQVMAACRAEAERLLRGEK